MKTTKTRYRSVLISALCGAFLFAGTTLFVFMRTDWLAIQFMLCVPVAGLMHFAACEAYLHNNTYNACIPAGAVIVNGMIGAGIFGLLASIVKLIIKLPHCIRTSHHEK